MKKLVILLIGFLFTGLLVTSCDNVALQHDDSNELIDSMSIVVDNAIDETVNPMFTDMQAFSQYVQITNNEHHFKNLLCTLPSSLTNTIAQKCIKEFGYVNMDSFLTMYYQTYNKELPPDVHIPTIPIDTARPNIENLPITPFNSLQTNK